MAIDGATRDISTSRSHRISARSIVRVLLQWSLLIFLIALIAVFSFLESRFVTIANFQNIAKQASPLVLLACGQAVVLIAGGVDVSVGSVIALGSRHDLAGRIFRFNRRPTFDADRRAAATYGRG